MARSILIISPVELFYEPRLRKAAYVFCRSGFQVDVFNALVNSSDAKQYETLKSNMSQIDFHEINITKNNLKSRLLWFLASILNVIVFWFWAKFRLQLFPNKGVLSKSLLLAQLPNKKYDYIYVNLIDTLPHAFNYKKKYESKIIYDSQEFFTGQYSLFNKDKEAWVNHTEIKLIGFVDYVLSTTFAMRSELLKKYPSINSIFRVRNMPLLQELPKEFVLNTNNVLKLIWHGKSINIGNRRGVHILIQAVLNCNSDVDLTLQGKLSVQEHKNLSDLINGHKNNARIKVLPPANATEIVASLVGYDVGIIGELPEELNQELTSSNKLFDFVGAELAIIVPNVKGLIETVNQYENGLVYQAGNVLELSEKIDSLNNDRMTLEKFKNKSKIAKNECYWEFDFKQLINKIQQK